MSADRRPATGISCPRTVTGYSLVILSGWACRYKVLKNGTRQITSFLLPGDFAHLNAFTRAPLDHAIGAISAVSIARVPWADVLQMVEKHPALRTAFLASQVADETILRSAIVSMGRRNALERVGHQLCELWCRAAAVDLIEDDELDFPITQADLADRTGLTAVHVNRVLQRLRNDGLIQWKDRHLLIPDFNRLARQVGFDQQVPGAPDIGDFDRSRRLAQFASYAPGTDTSRSRSVVAEHAASF